MRSPSVFSKTGAAGAVTLSSHATTSQSHHSRRRDLPRARRFYEALGWKTGAAPDDDVAFFQAGDMVLALWDRARLAEDSCVSDAGGWGGVALALNLESVDAVDAAVEKARAAGAVIGREPDRRFWGGYSAVIVDPDGHPWEIAHNPHWTVTPDGGLRLS